jgi:hypothetical protein
VSQVLGRGAKTGSCSAALVLNRGAQADAHGGT